MNKVMIIGSGMLASALSAAGAGLGLDIQVIPHGQLDVTRRDLVISTIKAVRPEIIFHTAALTRVNYCEQHPEEAYAVNSDGTRYIVEAAERAMSRLVYFSTDFVFDGSREWPWVEEDVPHPLNVYGVTKLAGENPVRAYHRGHIVRTSGIFGPRSDGKPARNFFSAITERLLQSGSDLPVVADQKTAITYAPHLATMVFNLLTEGMPVLSHLTSGGSDSWYGWACLAARACGQPERRVAPVRSDELEDRTPRPAYSVLGSSIAAVQAIMMMHPARPAVQTYVESLAKMYRQSTG